MDMEHEQTKRYEQWYWSAEGINNRLLYLGEDLDLRSVIIHTLQSLPREVASLRWNTVVLFLSGVQLSV
jgi:hypothetical protein